ncbi:MAG: response regulator [Burkholderiales bacterium]
MTSSILPRVFIADPSAAVMERLAAAIDDVAEIVGRATNARDALDGIRNGNPRITVLDIVLNGVELLRQIKNHQPPVIVIVLTHSAEDATRRLCLRHGADYFLDKIHEFGKVREIVISVGGR